MHLHFLCSVSICALLASMCVRECFKYEAKQWVLFVNGCYLDSDNVAAFFLLNVWWNELQMYTFVFECNELSINGQWLCDYPLFFYSLQSTVILLYSQLLYFTTFNKNVLLIKCVGSRRKSQQHSKTIQNRNKFY